jgi:hypothetical protein
MLSLADLSREISAYQCSKISLDAFEDWFRTVSSGMFGESEEVLRACISVEEAFSKLHFEGISELAFSRELGDAIPPSTSHAAEMTVFSFCSTAKAHLSVATAAAMIVLSVAPAGAISFHVAAGQPSVSANTVASHPWIDRTQATLTVPLECVVA